MLDSHLTDLWLFNNGNHDHSTGLPGMDVQQQLRGRRIISLTVHFTHAPGHLLCRTAFLFIAVSSSAFVMWSLCAIPKSLRFMALSVVAVGRHSLSPMPTFP